MVPDRPPPPSSPQTVREASHASASKRLTAEQSICVGRFAQSFQKPHGPHLSPWPPGKAIARPDSAAGPGCAPRYPPPHGQAFELLPRCRKASPRLLPATPQSSPHRRGAQQLRFPRVLGLELACLFHVVWTLRVTTSSSQGSPCAPVNATPPSTPTSRGCPSPPALPTHQAAPTALECSPLGLTTALRGGPHLSSGYRQSSRASGP